VGYTKVIQSGNYLEIYEYSQTLSTRPKRKRKSRGFTGTSRTKRYDNVARASKHFVRLIRSNLVRETPPALLTLTCYQKLSHKESWAAFSRFILQLNRLLGRKITYIAVLEYQKRGAPHFHALMWNLPPELPCTGYYDKQRRRFIHTCAATKRCERSTRNLQHQWLRGFVDCIQSDGNPKLATYLGKYLSKQMRDIRFLRKRAYNCSRDVLRPMSASGNSLNEYLEYIIPDEPEVQFYREFDTHWLGRCKITAINTKLYENNAHQNRTDNI